MNVALEKQDFTFLSVADIHGTQVALTSLTLFPPHPSITDNYKSLCCWQLDAMFFTNDLFCGHFPLPYNITTSSGEILHLPGT